MDREAFIQQYQKIERAAELYLCTTDFSHYCCDSFEPDMDGITIHASHYQSGCGTDYEYITMPWEWLDGDEDERERIAAEEKAAREDALRKAREALEEKRAQEKREYDLRQLAMLKSKYPEG